MTVYPECYAGLHHHCIGQGCDCACQIEAEHQTLSDDLYETDPKGED